MKTSVWRVIWLSFGPSLFCASICMIFAFLGILLVRSLDTGFSMSRYTPWIALVSFCTGWLIGRIATVTALLLKAGNQSD